MARIVKCPRCGGRAMGTLHEQEIEQEDKSADRKVVIRIATRCRFCGVSIWVDDGKEARPDWVSRTLAKLQSAFDPEKENDV